MKKIVFLFVVFSFFSCNNDDSQGDYFNVAVPILMNKTDFRNSVEVQSPKPIDETGKIYAYDQYIFVNNKFHGIQVIDNTNPALPQAIAYIKVPGNVDIAIKDDYLYADSSSDLVVFDISDMDNIKVIERLEDVFSVYDYQIPEAADYADFGSFNYSEEIIVGWTIEKRESSSVYEGGMNNITNIELARFGRELRMIDRLQDQIAKFLTKVVEVAALDCIRDLIGFLNRIVTDGRKVLLQIPGASGLGIAQPRHDFNKARQFS
jgi:hypothetical protein